MIAEEIKVLTAIINLSKNGGGKADVFDVIYETGVRYPQLKPVLDGLVNAGEIAASDIRYYALCGDPDEKLKELTLKYPEEVKTARLELDGQLGNEHAKEDEDAAADERKKAFDNRREEFLRRLRERREEVEAARRAEEEDDEDDYAEDEDEDDDDDDDIDYEGIRRIIEGEDYNDQKGAEADDEFFIENKDRYTNELKIVIREAFDFALQRKTSFVGSGHLVYAMLFNQCKAGDMLDGSGTSRVFYGYYVRSALSDCGKAYHTGFNEEGRAMLSRALEIAEEGNGKGAEVDTVHLLKAVLEKSECIAVRCLSSARTDMTKLADEIRKYLNGEND